MGRPSVREQLVERTLNLLIDRGFEGASVSDLVTAAGVPKGSFYNHFASKEHFAVEHVHRYVRDLDLDALRKPGGPALAAVREHFEQQIGKRTSGAISVGCLLGTLSTSVDDSYPDLLAAVREGFADWIDALTTALRAAAAEGDIQLEDKPELLAAAMVDGFEGAISRARVTRDSQPLDVFCGTTLPRLLHH